MKWAAVIFGPKNTPLSESIFKLILEFSEEYPNQPQVVIFNNSNIFHPNVYLDGKLCFDLLDKKWSPLYNVSSILSSIQSLLFDPNPNSPANLYAAEMFINNRFDYFRIIHKLNSSI